jgi:3-hydroxyisobutyrate dehydrogenase-like beta-hydroxyacid dehydrogenase
MDNMASNQVGYIGIGRMGVRMATRLLNVGIPLAVHDANKAAAEPLLARGARWCATPAEVARQCTIVMSCLPGPEEVAEVMDGPHGVLSAAPPPGTPGPLLIEMSTIGPAQSRDLAKRSRAAGFSYIDAPISNGVGPAETGELTIMIGGNLEDFERAKPVLSHLGNRLYHMGDIGTGNFTKIANQVIYLSYVASVCEIARAARGLGMDVPNFIDVMRNSVAGRPMMTHWEDRFENGDRVAGFQISRLLKDLQLGADVCTENAIDIPVLETVIQTYRKASDAGHADLDMTAIYSV